VAPGDYAALSAPVSFAAGVTSQMFSVAVVGDTTDEGADETFEVTLTAPSNATLAGDPSATGTIQNDDAVAPPAGTLQFSAPTYSIGEAGVQATITVTRAGGSSGAVAVDYATSNGSATAGSDYTATAGTLNWADADSTSQTFNVPISNDATVESDETVNLTLTNPTNGSALGAPNTAVLTITDDDVAPGTKSFSGPTNTGSGTQTVVFTGGGTGCGFDVGTALVATPLPLPAGGYVFPHGVFASTIGNCTVGATLSFTATYPQALPAGAVFWKYGRTSGDPTPHWYQYPASIVGNTATFVLTDGGAGDDDLTANGTIVDPSGPAFLQPGTGTGVAAPAVIPTLGEVSRWLLLLLVAGIAWWQLRAPFAMRGHRRQ
jgi:hypothetical protein